MRKTILPVADLLNFFLARKVFRQKPPLIASFKLTYRCNLACRTCPFHLRANEENAHMSWDGAVNALAALKNCGTRIVVFEGGEPLLWRDGAHDFPELVTYAKKLFLRVGVTTNGTLPLDVPADVLWVSLDGLKETHDRLRSGSFDRAWNNLRVTKHPKVFVHFTMNRENWRELEYLLKRLGEIPAVWGTTLQLFYPYGQGEEALSLSPAERREALETAIRLKKNYPLLNSRSGLKAMIENTWSCHDDILVNVDPGGTITSGCYVKNRGTISCRDCGFTPVTEASGALDLSVPSLFAGWRIFLQT
ncbi:MAG: radical SAM protein [Deltaproteobacteria bacterium]|nr:radical SAM protein [Deltaproteobacteria bacterium]